MQDAICPQSLDPPALLALQVMNFSSAELDILQRHTQAALDTDEDWNQDNFS